jgi:hypothetical protein
LLTNSEFTAPILTQDQPLPIFSPIPLLPLLFIPSNPYTNSPLDSPRPFFTISHLPTTLYTRSQFLSLTHSSIPLLIKSP